LKNASKT